MRELTKTYRIRRFSSSRDPDYQSALAIYIATATPEIRTNSNQISYWLDRGYSEFGDEFCVCGFYADDKIVGFAEFAFFRQEAVLFLDYLSLHPEAEGQSEYLQFTRMVKEWISAQPFEYDFAATEIPFERSGDEPTERTRLEVQLYKQMGFGVVHCPYRQPPLGVASPQSDLPAFLMLAGKKSINVVRAETILHIVRTVYQRHYLRWYAPFLDAVDHYETLLSERLDEVRRNLSGKADVEVNGMRMLTPAVPQAATARAPSPQFLAPALITLLSLLLFICALLLVHRLSDPPWQVTAFIIGSSLVAFAAVFSLFHDPSRRTLNSLLSALIRVFGKRK